MAMPSPNKFGAALFVLSLCALLIGGMALVENIEFWRYGQEASMTLSDPNQKLPGFQDDLNYTRRDVVMNSTAGNVVMPQMSLPKVLASQLDAGRSIRVAYMTNNPKRVFYQGRRPDNP